MRTREKWLLPVLGLAVAAALFLGFVRLSGWIDRQAKDARSGPLHTFEVRPEPQFLADALALDKARQALVLDGYELAAWRASESRRTGAPDGTADVYLDRNRPGGGTITFWDESGRDPNPRRYVTVELKGTQVLCIVATPK